MFEQMPLNSDIDILLDQEVRDWTSAEEKESSHNATEFSVSFSLECTSQRGKWNKQQEEAFFDTVLELPHRRPVICFLNLWLCVSFVGCLWHNWAELQGFRAESSSLIMCPEEQILQNLEITTAWGLFIVHCQISWGLRMILEFHRHVL